MTRKICIVTGTRAEYGLLYWLMKEIEADKELQLQLIVTGMHLSPKFGLTYKEIEKEFTLHKTMEGPDHKASLEPDELKVMVKAIRNIELALGNSVKKPSKSEIPNKQIARKSIVAKMDIKKDEILSEENITIKRPGNGINPMRWDEIVGTIATKDYKED